ncbi:uncharacterized protein LOC110033116 [Phalaenopsis equestris]|uniref:uncharacterized protein LOC110033116 n=1 Tax=Phalaenopsis equestris TaxID=78828 RepID=UPI0009E24642|nr:uncharacterized protein LOC110033116 [Phalaenopsis equestris]
MMTVKVVLCLVAEDDLHLERMNVRKTFLHGNLEDELYLMKTQGYKVLGKECLVCKLKKSIYGLKKAPRQRYKSVRFFIIPLFFFFFFLSFYPNLLFSISNNNTDYKALISFKNGLLKQQNSSSSSAATFILNSWGDDNNKHFCSWEGVTCGRKHPDRVTGLDLGSTGLIENGEAARPTTSTDVYSFGIILLEMLTRRRPTDHIFNYNLNLYNYVRMVFPHRINNIIDLKMFTEEERQTNKWSCQNINNCLLSLAEVGLSCSATLPEERPSMREVSTKFVTIVVPRLFPSLQKYKSSNTLKPRVRYFDVVGKICLLSSCACVPTCCRKPAKKVLMCFVAMQQRSSLPPIFLSPLY